jgi:hypothetical protein
VFILDVTSANEYISLNCIDVEEWVSNIEDDQKTRLLNVASRTLTDAYPNLLIPDPAVYEFANVLSIMFSDTNKLQLQGIDSFTIQSLGTFSFRSMGVRQANYIDFTSLIPPISVQLIAKANNKPASYKVRYTGMK